MPDEIIPAEGEQPNASPADAGNPPATAGAGEKVETSPKTDSKPVKTSSDFARERILKRENDRLKAEREQRKTEDDDGIDPAEVEVVEKVVKKHYGDRFDELDTRIIQEDVDKAIKSSPYETYMTPEEKDSVHKLSLDPKYAQLPFDDLIVLSLKGRVTQIGAEMAKKASSKINDTRLPTAGASKGAQKSVAEMSDAEYAEYRTNVLGIR